jgi:wyosine [tRNA(Phe)-imidazoG37] synthetase (radical SAM superfamily)
MPSHQEVKEFAEGLADRLDYRVGDEDPKSRAVLLVRKDVSSLKL